MKIYLTKLAYLQLLIEVKKYNHIETGAILVGRVIGNEFYVFESLDSGINCKRGPAIFYRDNPYSEHLVDVVRAKYENATAIGFWHRHPGNFNQFSSADLIANIDMARVLNKNIISGLVNIFDGQIRLKFWRITLENEYEEGQIIIGDEYFKDVLFYKKLVNVENIILQNELGLNKNQIKSNLINDTTIGSMEDSKAYEKNQNQSKKIGKILFFKNRKPKEKSLSDETSISNSENNIDIDTQILNVIKLDIELLSEDRIICQKYTVNDNPLYLDKVFLTFINLKNNKKCDVVLYYIEKELVFYIFGNEYKYTKSNLSEHIKKLLVEEK